MPELPEVETVVRELNKKLKGLKISKVAVNAPKLVAIGANRLSPTRSASKETALEFSSLLKDKIILGVSRRAKLLIFSLSSDYTLLVHLKMTGQFIFEDLEQKKVTSSKYKIINKKTAPLTQLPSAHTHVIFDFANGSTLFFNDVRKFAYLKLIRNNEVAEVADFKEYGPEPLEKAFTFEYFQNQASKRSATIKQLLMDSRIVTGIGNIYSDEILFHAGVLPTRTARSLSVVETKAVFDQIRPVLKKGIEAKGSSVGDFIRTDGSWGSMGKYHYVYGRKGQECKTCKTIIKSQKIGGRTSSYCPKCQS